jgi:uncharacterized RDD family membrane protein YckC
MNSPQRPTRYAGFWIRLIADLIDTTVLTVASWFAELMILGIVYWVGHYAQPFQDAFNALWLQIANAVIYTIFAVVYYTWGHYRYGTTLGKKPFRIYVVSESTRQPISMKQSILRTVGYLVSYIPVGAGFLMAAFHPEKRALHDLIAGTVSISKERS